MRLYYPSTHYEPKADTEYYCEMSGKKMIVCFEGSEDPLKGGLKDWLYNLLFWKDFRIMNGHLFTVHYGLYRKWHLVRPQIFKLIMENEPEEIELSGYSQGAAIASFMHNFIKEWFPGLRIKTVIAGCPKLYGFIGIGRQKALGRDIISLRIGNDIVTKLPPLYMSTGKIIQKGIREVFKLSIKDHSLNGYNKLLEEWGSE